MARHVYLANNSYEYLLSPHIQYKHKQNHVETLLRVPCKQRQLTWSHARSKNALLRNLPGESKRAVTIFRKCYSRNNYNKNIRKCGVYFFVTYINAIGPVTFFVSVVFVHLDSDINAILVLQHCQRV